MQERPKTYSRLKVPDTSVTSQYDPSPVAGLDPYPKHADNWIQITTPTHIVAHLIQCNITHYSQANPTPFRHTVHGAHIGYHGTNNASKTILQGTYNYSLDQLLPETRQYIKEL